ncbi:hypothetical protein MKX01_014857 [Papaver californicum]|nr:hypothetical protein MKX01_014857 [Papaver californicum]
MRLRRLLCGIEDEIIRDNNKLIIPKTQLVFQERHWQLHFCLLKDSVDQAF